MAWSLTRKPGKHVAKRSYLPDPVQVEWTSLQQMWPGQSTERSMQSYLQYALYGYASNSVVFACSLARLQLLAQAEFKFQWLDTRRLFGNEDLALLERPWPNGTSGDLIANMEQHVTIAGNSFVRRTRDSLVVMRPDWTDIVSVVIVDGEDAHGYPQTHREVIGYLYSEGGYGVSEPVFYPVEDVAHWAPIPDPLATWRGMSWMTPVLREINADVAMTQHRQSFFDNAATPNILLKYKDKLRPEQLDSLKARWQSRFAGAKGAGATVILDEGADLTVVGSTFESMRFDDIQAAGEARIASASGVPAIVAGLQAGLDAATYSNYGMAIKAMANGTGAFLWQSLCAAVAKLVTPPDGARLWYDTTSIPALREDAKDRADAMQVMASAASTFITAGYEPDSVNQALLSGDLGLLKHSGMISVQLIPNDITSLKNDQKTQAALDKAKVSALDPTKESATLPAARAEALVVRQEPQQINITMDQQPAPVVNVTVAPAQPAPPSITVSPTPVTVTTPVTVQPATPTVTVLPSPPVTRKIKRNSAGEIVAVEES